MNTPETGEPQAEYVNLLEMRLPASEIPSYTREEERALFEEYGELKGKVLRTLLEEDTVVAAVGLLTVPYRNPYDDTTHVTPGFLYYLSIQPQQDKPDPFLHFLGCNDDGVCEIKETFDAVVRPLTGPDGIKHQTGGNGKEFQDRFSAEGIRELTVRFFKARSKREKAEVKENLAEKILALKISPALLKALVRFSLKKEDCAADLSRLCAISHKLILANVKGQDFLYKKYKYMGYGGPNCSELVMQTLLRAVDSFDCTKGVLFSTYLVKSTRVTLKRYAQQEKQAVKMPTHIAEKVGRVLDAMNSVYGCTGVNGDVQAAAKKARMPVAEVREVIRALMTCYAPSLEAPLKGQKAGKDETFSLGDTLHAANRVTPEDLCIRHDTNRALRKLMAAAGLNSYRTEAVELMFLGGEERTEQEVSERLDLSRGAISLRYLAAKRDLKKHCQQHGIAESDYS